MLVKKEVLISADIKKVWEVFSQLENWPKWGGYILKTKWISGSRWERNSKFVQKISGFLFIDSYSSRCEILEIRKLKFVEWRGTRKLMQGTHSFKFQKTGKKTKVSNIEYFKGPLAPLIFPLIKNKFEIYFEQFNQGLKNECEEQ